MRLSFELKIDGIDPGCKLPSQRHEDGVAYLAAFFQNVMIPEAQDVISLREDECVSLFIAFVSRMLATVDLNDQLLLATAKIREVGADRKLAGEFITAEFAVLQFQPEQCFGLVVAPAQASRARGRSCFTA